MQTDITHAQDKPSYTEVLKEIGASAKDLVQNEFKLVKAEMSESLNAVARHSVQTAVFGGLCLLSVFPFLAFLVIGLGELMAGRYWLSSLIVAIGCAAIGGFLAYRAYSKLKEQDLTLPRSRQALDDAQIQNPIRRQTYGYPSDELH